MELCGLQWLGGLIIQIHGTVILSAYVHQVYNHILCLLLQHVIQHLQCLTLYTQLPINPHLIHYLLHSRLKYVSVSEVVLLEWHTVPGILISEYSSPHFLQITQVLILTPNLEVLLVKLVHNVLLP